MGWFIALAGIVLLVALKWKVADRETVRNLIGYGKVLAVVVAVIVLWLFVSIIKK